MGSGIPAWALSPVNCLPKLAKIKMHWQQTFPPASLGKGWGPARWRTDMGTNAGKGAGLRAEPFETPFFESFPLSPPMFLPEPGESSGKCWSRKIRLLAQGRVSSPATTVPTPAILNLPESIKKQQQTVSSLLYLTVDL